MVRIVAGGISALAFVSLLGFGAPVNSVFGTSTVTPLGFQEYSLEAEVTEAAAEFFAAAPQSAGLSVAVIHDRKMSTFHFGASELGGERPPNDQTLYAIASVTKTVVGSLLSKASVDGRLSLEDDVRDYLDGAYENLEREGRHIQIAHLVNHLSGLPRSLPDRPEMVHTHPSYAGDPIPWAAYVANALNGYTRADFLADLGNVELETAPGSAFSYSNAAAQLAGLVLEQVYGRPLEDIVRSEITGPLGMSSTTFAPEAAQAAALAIGYDDRGRAMPKDLSAAGAAGGLMSTAADLARYVRWHLDETDPAVWLSHTATVGHPDGSGPGLNWFVQQSSDGVRRIAGDGSVPGFSSTIVFYPELQIGIVVLANQLDRSIPGLAQQLANRVLGSLDSNSF